MPPSPLPEIGPEIAPKTGPPVGRLLALETSGRQGSITVMEVRESPSPEGGGHSSVETRGGGFREHHTILTRELPPQERSARTLVPTIGELLAEIGWKPKSLDCIAIAIGPGSFTGLRVGVTTAKTLAYVSGAALIAINTLDAIAEPSWLDHASNNAPLWTALDAQRNEVFAAYYKKTNEGPPTEATEETQVQRLTQSEFFAKLKPNDRVIAPHAAVLSQRYEGHPCKAKDITWITAQPMADAVARLAAAKWKSNQLADPFQLAPQYHRISAAEENLR